MLLAVDSLRWLGAEQEPRSAAQQTTASNAQAASTEESDHGESE